MKKVKITVLKTTLDEQLARDRLPHAERRTSFLC